MEVLGILRVVALICFLGFGFHGTADNAGQESTDAELCTAPRTFTEPSTLRDLLDILGKLNESDIKAQIAQKVQDRIKAYLKPTGILGRGIKLNLQALMRTIPELREQLLKDPDQYGKFSRFNPCDDYIDYYTDVLVHWLPVLHSELWFLYFQTSEESVRIGGGWRRFQRFGKSYYTTQLHRWLTDQLDRKTVPYIPKGFNPEDLHESNYGHHVAANASISLSDGGPLNYVQYGLFLLSPTWHDSNLGHSVLFLQEFCRDVKAKKFDKYTPGSTIERLKAVCPALYKDITSLYDGTLYTYRDKLRPKAFSKYAEWLRHNLDGMIEALRRMSSKMSRWSKTMLYNCEYSGPFRYGFVFKNANWESYIKDKLPTAISILTMADTGSLSKLYKVLRPRPAQPVSLGGPFPAASFQQPTIAGPVTLKGLLDLLGILSGAVIKSQIVMALDRRVQAWVGMGWIPDERVEKNLAALIETIPELRQSLLKDPDNYERFSRFNPCEECIAYYVEILIKWLPVLHSELWFLYFQTSEECVHLGGGSWKKQKFGPSFHTTQLHRWLTDQLDKNSVPYIPKGFNPEDLHDTNVGAHIAVKTGIYINEGARLNYAQYGLFFLSPTWHDSNLASAVLFIREFCGEATENEFDKYRTDERYVAVKTVCKMLSVGIMFLTNILHPLYDGSLDTYRGMLKPGVFPRYAEWLQANLGPMKKSLGQMLSESKEWSRDVFHKAASPGPFRYGFLFKDCDWSDTLYYTLPTVLFSLTGQALAPPNGMRQFTSLKAAAEGCAQDWDMWQTALSMAS